MKILARSVPPENESDLTLRLLEAMLGQKPPTNIRVRLWDGTSWPDDGPGQATLVLKHPGALRNMFLPGTEVGLAEAYLYDDFDVEGDIEAVFYYADTLKELALGWSKKLSLANELRRLPARDRTYRPQRGPADLKGSRHSVERDRQAVTYHYNVSNDFYQLWLDSRMVYSCAYFHSPSDDLETAQENKLDYICRKLRLKPGQRLLDIGCGWGGLVIHAAQRYGVEVTGITLSQPQADLANERIRAAGMADRARALIRDYREVNEPEAYDALVSVGMFEHVGLGMLPKYFELAHRLLKPGGVLLNHGISTGTQQGPRKGPTFTEVYVFPDGELVPIASTLRIAWEAGFEVRDVESLREHYALTLRHWVRRLERQHSEALNFVDEPTYRVWRLFMSGSAYGFTRGGLNVYQTLLVKPDRDGRSHLPLTRADWYGPAPESDIQAGQYTAHG